MGSLTKVQEQLEAAAIAVAELEWLGCRVWSVTATSGRPRARVVLSDGAALRAYLDRQQQRIRAYELQGSEWRECEVEYRDCDVFWSERL